MAVGLRATRADTMFDTLIAGMAAKAIQLHTADPGAAGTTAVANAGRRQSITWAASSGGIKANSNTVLFANVAGPGTQDYTHWTLWDSLTVGAGNCWGSGPVVANPIPQGNDFTLDPGDIKLTTPVMG